MERDGHDMECIAVNTLCMQCRPLNGMLVAQRISLPQMWISAAVLAAHVVVCWLLISHWQWGPAGAAVALTLASVLTIIATSAYVIASGLQDRVWGTPTRTALRVRTPSTRSMSAATAELPMTA